MNTLPRPSYATVTALLLSAGLMTTSAATSASDASCEKSSLDDAWIDARIETTYLFNRQLNNFTINTDVSNGVVRLSGTVRSAIDRDLAEQIAANVDGVSAVQNDLVVSPSDGPKARDAFSHAVGDVTTTAHVMSNLKANDNLDGTEISVDTRDNVVTLSGAVTNDAQRQLAVLIARNTPDVRSVSNEIRVAPHAEG